jgi:hypothetical protein
MDTAKSLLELSEVEYEALVETYIERETLATGEMPISDFFQLLLETEAARQGETIEVEGKIVDDKLVLSLVAGHQSNVRVQGNQILLDDGGRIIVRLKSPHLAD